MTVFQVMRRPRWIAALVLALAVAAGFAALGQWQLERAVTSNAVNTDNTEQIRNLEDLAVPQSPVMEAQAGRMVAVSGTFAADDFTILAGRDNAGVRGYWVTGNLQVGTSAAPTSVAVALGWTEDEAAALRARDRLSAESPSEIVGRYLPTEAPRPTDAEDNGVDSFPTTMAVAALINTWSSFSADADVYGGYVVSADAPTGLVAIDSPAPELVVELNWLNIFYAVEWVIFAGFAVFLWYRLVKDAWERETEEAQLTDG